MTAGPPADGLPAPQRHFAILTIAIAMTMSVLDGAIANVALPTIARELNVSAAASIWVINAYQLAITAGLLPLAALGDRLGHHRVYLAGLAIFVLGSVFCALAGSLTALVLARVLQGLGAAAIMSMNGALVRFTYPHARLARGISFNAMVISIATAAGPTVASAILTVASWHFLFAVNLPLGLLAIGLGLRFLPRSSGVAHRFDVPAALLTAFAFASVIFGAERLARDGSLAAAPLVFLGLVAFLALLRRERGQARPLLPVDLLRLPQFAFSVIGSILSFSAQMLAFASLPFLFQREWGRGVVESGLLMTPWPLAIAVVAPLAGRLADRNPTGRHGALGMLLYAAGLASLAALAIGAAAPSPLDIGWRMALCGVGFGLFQSPNNRALVAAAPRNRSGAAGGTQSTARLLGQTLGAVAVGVLLHASHDAVATASAWSLAAASLLALIGGAVSLLRPRPPSSPVAYRP